MPPFRWITSYFTKTEILLWMVSALLITAPFLIFDRTHWLTLTDYLTGVTAIMFNAKSNLFGQFLMIVFSLRYGYISYTFSHYGEMITYLGMRMPMADFALIAWFRHPLNGKRSQVEVGSLQRPEILVMFGLTAVVTFGFYLILKYFHTANLLPSTLSIATSFVAVYLTFRSSPYFSLAYALNDVVLIMLWTLANFENTRYLSVVVCFMALLCMDLYGFISWKAMKRQQETTSALSDAPASAGRT